MAGCTDFLPSEAPDVQASGGLSYSLFESKPAGAESRSFQHVTTLNVNPYTYILAPWLATVNGSVNLSKTSESAGEAENSTGSNSVTGSMTLSVLPQSLYPTELSYSRFDRTQNLGETDVDTTGDTFRISNQATLPDDLTIATRYSVDSSVGSDGYTQNIQDITVEGDKLFTVDNLRIGLNHRETEIGSSSGDILANHDSFTLRHRSQPLEDLNSDSTTTVRVGSYTGGGVTEEGTTQQGVTMALYRPAWLPGVLINGAMRTFNIDNSISRLTGEREEVKNQSFYGNLGTSYTFAPRLVGNISGNAGLDNGETSYIANNVNQTTERSTMSLGMSSGLTYSSIQHSFEGFTWNWYSGGSLSASHSEASITSNTAANVTPVTLGLVTTQSATAGHSLFRDLDLPLLDIVRVSLSETLGVSNNSVQGMGETIGHSASLSRSSREGREWDMFSLTGTDSRAMGADLSSYQLVNLQYSRGYDPDRFSSISGNLTWQMARQSFGEEVGLWEDSTSASLAYREINFLGLENLSFNSDLSITPESLLSTRSSTSRLNAFGSYDRRTSLLGTQRWTNRLDYGIGKLRLSLVGRLYRNETGLGESTLFTITRRF